MATSVSVVGCGVALDWGSVVGDGEGGTAVVVGEIVGVSVAGGADGWVGLIEERGLTNSAGGVTVRQAFSSGVIITVPPIMVIWRQNSRRFIYQTPVCHRLLS